MFLCQTAGVVFGYLGWWAGVAQLWQLWQNCGGILDAAGIEDILDSVSSVKRYWDYRHCQWMTLPFVAWAWWRCLWSISARFCVLLVLYSLAGLVLRLSWDLRIVRWLFWLRTRRLLFVQQRWGLHLGRNSVSTTTPFSCLHITE